MTKWSYLEHKINMELKLTNMIKRYSNSPILKIADLVMDSGELIGLIGNNGAGKSTLLRILLDLVKPDEGTVLSRNKDISTTEEWKTYTAAYIDTSFLIDFLTPEEYFNFIAQGYGIKSATMNKEIAHFHDFMKGEILGKNKYIRDFSAGNRQKIGIIGAILSMPEVLILDEPFNFLDPSSQFFIRDHFYSMNRELGTTIILSSHNLESTVDIASRVILLEYGQIIKDIQRVDMGTKEELTNYFRARSLT